MFSKNSNILYITKNIVKAYKVTPRAKSKLEELVALKWNSKNRSEILLQALQKFSKKTVNILFADDVSYSVEFDIPANLKKAEEKTQVLNMFQEQVPEVFQDGEWDYYIIIKSKDVKRVLAYAPVKDFAAAVFTEVAAQDFELEKVEVEKLATLKNPNPILGMISEGSPSMDTTAVKSNTTPKKDTPSSDKTVSTQNPTKPRLSRLNFSPPKISKKKLILLALLLIVGISICVYFLLPSTEPVEHPKGEGGVQLLTPEEFAAKKAEKAKESSVTPPSEDTADQAALEEGDEDATTVTEELPTNQKKISVLILNGSGVPGLAGRAAQSFKTAGFLDVEAGNADTFELIENEIETKEGFDTSILGESLLDEFDFEDLIVKPSLNETSTYDVIIKLGKNYAQK